MNLPRTDYHLRTDNPVERMFWGKLPLERATSYFFYHKGSDFRRILHQLKYGGRKDLGETMGRFMAAELTVSGFFHSVDVIVPILYIPASNGCGDTIRVNVSPKVWLRLRVFLWMLLP